jgi:2-oxoglutarate dehydrogenase E1 component
LFNRAIVPTAEQTKKSYYRTYPNADDYVWATEEPKNGSIQLYVNELRSSKMEISFVKAYSAPASGSYTRAKTPSCYKMVFDKDLFR